MALFATYADCQTGVASWLDADDTSQVPLFIELAELELQKDLRLREMVTTKTSLVDSDQQITLPADFIQVKRLKIDGHFGTLRQENWDYVDELTTTGTPIYFAIQGTQLKIGPGGSDETVRLTYWQKPTPLSDSNDTNVFTDYAAEALLYQSIMQGLKWLIEDERLPHWQSRYDAAVFKLNEQARLGEQGDGPLARRAAAQRDIRKSRNRTTA